MVTIGRTHDFRVKLGLYHKTGLSREFTRPKADWDMCNHEFVTPKIIIVLACVSSCRAFVMFWIVICAPRRRARLVFQEQIRSYKTGLTGGSQWHIHAQVRSVLDDELIEFNLSCFPFTCCWRFQKCHFNFLRTLFRSIHFTFWWSSPAVLWQ